MKKVVYRLIQIKTSFLLPIGYLITNSCNANKQHFTSQQSEVQLQSFSVWSFNEKAWYAGQWLSTTIDKSIKLGRALKYGDQQKKQDSSHHIIDWETKISNQVPIYKHINHSHALNVLE